MRAHNFSAGPAALPEPVLKKAQAELLDWEGTGASVMELSHRSAEFIGVAARAERNLRTLMAIPDDYAVLFLQGGATTQFATVPLNLRSPDGVADYVHTGSWAKKAIAEAQRSGRVNVAASSEEDQFFAIPAREQWRLTRGADYVHITENETIGGVEYREPPDVGDVPLVSDASSMILSRPQDVSRYGLIYAGAQKNLGPSGISVVIVRRELLGRAAPSVPSMLNYAEHDAADSMMNTPPTLAWYLVGLVLEWLIEQGGLVEMERRAQRKSALIYSTIDQSNFYSCPVAPEFRSRMNVPFTLADDALDKEFLAGAAERKLIGLAGHRSVGGMRASIYNAVPEASVAALVDYMQAFERSRG